MRKNLIWSLIAFVLIFSILGSTAFAESATVTGTAVNLRSGPGTGYRILDTLGAGAVVEVVDRSYGSWYEVSYNGQRGYMSANYLSLGDSSGTVVPTYSSSSSRRAARSSCLTGSSPPTRFRLDGQKRQRVLGSGRSRSRSARRHHGSGRHRGPRGRPAFQ